MFGDYDVKICNEDVGEVEINQWKKIIRYLWRFFGWENPKYNKGRRNTIWEPKAVIHF